MSADLSYFDLGASVYTPCTHDNLAELLQSGLESTRSIVLCLEDAVNETDLRCALNNLKKALVALKPSKELKRFIRPRNPLVLAEILRYPDIEKIDGFVLPKFDLNTIALYQNVIAEQSNKRFVYMPTLETAQVFDVAAMRQLSLLMQQWSETILCLRIGGNDLMNLLGIKRMQGMTTYDTPLKTVIDQLLMQFRPAGFELSAPVFDMIDDLETLEKELKMDLVYGFFAKTAVHPAQVKVIEQAFSEFTDSHRVQAQSLLAENSAAVYKLNGQMMEPSCQKSWAKRTMQLAERYS